MLQLHKDPNFHYETIRALARTRYYGADLAEVLHILPNIKPGDFNDWFNEWHNLALRVLSTIDESKSDSYSPITLRDVYLRASTYFFVADFFLHGNPSDPRIGQSYELWTKYFDKANALFPIPGQRATIPTEHGFDIPIIVFRASDASASNPRPTLIVGGGFDSNIEELYHVFGCAALERGYNVVLYEGPGQPTVLHKHHVGFIPDWEKVVTPVVDYLFEHSTTELDFIDTKKMGLIGYSLGGYLAARAAAFEPRLAALICVDGVWTLEEPLLKAFPQCEAPWHEGDSEALASSFATTTSSPTGNRWMHDHIKYSFNTTSDLEAFNRAAQMTLTGVVDKIKMPAFIGDAAEDIFFAGQPARVASGIGSNATLVEFSTEQAAGAHCQSGALVYLNQQLLEWFAGVVGR